MAAYEISHTQMGDEKWNVGRRLGDCASPARQRKESERYRRKDRLELLEVRYDEDPTMRLKVGFTFFMGTGTRSTAVVYFEVEPGHRLGTHTAGSALAGRSTAPYRAVEDHR